MTNELCYAQHSLLRLNDSSKTATMTTTNRSETAAEYVARKMRTKTIDRVIGQSTTTAYNLLEDQLAVAASAVSTPEWGGNHGHLATIIKVTKYRAVTANRNLNVDPLVEPAAVEPTINATTTPFGSLRLQKQQEIKNQKF